MSQFYKNVNVNPMKKEVGDCVIRAIANAEDKSWYEVFDALTKIARENCSAPNWKDTYEAYLSKYPTIPVKYEYGGKKYRLTASDFWNDPKLKEGNYVIRQAHHVTCVKNGVCEDIWDCSHRASYKIWKVK